MLAHAFKKKELVRREKTSVSSLSTHCMSCVSTILLAESTGKGAKILSFNLECCSGRCIQAFAPSDRSRSNAGTTSLDWSFSHATPPFAYLESRIVVFYFDLRPNRPSLVRFCCARHDLEKYTRIVGDPYIYSNWCCIVKTRLSARFPRSQ